MLDLINRIRKINFQELTPAQIAVLIAGVIIAVWLVGQILSLLAALLPIAIGVLVLYFGFQWITSDSDEIPDEAKQTRQQRTVNQAIQNVLNFRSGTAADDDETKAQATAQTAPAADLPIEDADTEALIAEAAQETEREYNLTVEQVVNPETGFKEPNISRLIEQEEEKLKQMDQEAEEVMSQLEARRQRLLNQQKQQGGE